MTGIIIEDESLIAKDLQSKIEAVSNDLEIIKVLPSVRKARKWFSQYPEPDLIFMDIQLSDGVSFELFEHFQFNCPVVFTTAYEEYAIRAFRVNGIDYLLKPIKTDELKNALDKCRAKISAQQKAPSGIQDLLLALQRPQAQPTLYKEKFMVGVRDKILIIATSNIACFTRDNLNYLHTFTGERFVLDFATLEEIEELLDPRVFYRASRQAIVHIDAIREIQNHTNYKLSLILKPPLKIDIEVSRDRAPLLKKWIDR